jgi:hypothetical protein
MLTCYVMHDWLYCGRFCKYKHIPLREEGNGNMFKTCFGYCLDRTFLFVCSLVNGIKFFIPVGIAWVSKVNKICFE